MDEVNDAALIESHREWLRARRHWLGLPVVKAQEGSFSDVLTAVPHFGRQPFAMPSPNGDDVGINAFLDMVYRVSTARGERPVPVGVVSKNYRLVDHHQVLRTVQQALIDNDLDLDAFRVKAQWTVHGERAHFSLLFPPEERFTMPMKGKDDGMRFRIEIFNSVEGSYRLIAVAGWLRFVCSNGLILGTALFHLKQQHRQPMQVEDLGRHVRESIELAGRDKATFRGWLAESIDPEILVRWIDDEVCCRWGIKAAVRVLGIVRSGQDVEPVGDLRSRQASKVNTRSAGRVPGVDGPVDNLFGVSQVLSWMAGQRAEVAEDLEWRGQVADLVEKLHRRNP